MLPLLVPNGPPVLAVPKGPPPVVGAAAALLPNTLEKALVAGAVLPLLVPNRFDPPDGVADAPNRLVAGAKRLGAAAGAGVPNTLVAG